MNHSPLLLQLVVILSVARVLGLILRRFGQPAVIGEMAAGIVLGPIVLGALAPELHASLFEPASLASLSGLSQLGLALFMFIVGAEIRLPMGVRRQLIAAAWIGSLSVFLPMLLGLGVAFLLYSSLAPAGVSFWPFALYLAAAMSVTAFPVMARILKDRDMTQTTVGRLALTATALADVLAWLLLAVVAVLATSQQDWTRFYHIFLGLGALALLLFTLVRPLVSWLLGRYAEDGKPDGALLATLLIGTFACGYLTSLLGVHAVFGAFLFGASLPRDDRLLAALVERIEHIAIVALMPIFFALAGLSTTGDAFGDGGLVALAWILVAAIVGKMLGGAWGARLAGYAWRPSLAVGALMNARGLVELIVIKLGLDMGVIDHRLFTLLMVMALVTTFMTSPLLTLFNRSEAVPAEVESPKSTRAVR